MRVFGIVLCLVAFVLTTYSALVHKAPRIEAEFAERALSALAPPDVVEFEVRMDGREATLEGMPADEETPGAAPEAVAAVPGLLAPIDDVAVVDEVSPYRLQAVKDERGVAVEGLAPTDVDKTLIEADARVVFGEDAVIDIRVATGAPEGDWRAAAGSGFVALATMRRGRLSIVDQMIALEGDVAGEADVDAIDLFGAAAPEAFAWTRKVDLEQDTVGSHTFSVVKEPGGRLRMTGHVPNETIKKALIAEGRSIATDQPLPTDIQIAADMPGDEWPSLVRAGISAMRDIESGRLDVSDNEIAFSSDADSGADDVVVEPNDAGEETIAATEFATLAPKSEPASGEEDVTEAAALPAGDDDRDETEPSPVITLTVDKVDGGIWSVRGTVPDEHAGELIVAALAERAGADRVEADLELAGEGPNDDWLEFAADRLRSLDEVNAGQLKIEDFDAHLIGVVETPENIEPVRTALAAIDKAMKVDLQPVDPRPLASLDLVLTPDDGLSLSGVLPERLSSTMVMTALGIEDFAGELGENGRGAADLWLRDLTRLGRFLPVFERVAIVLDDDGLRLGGELLAHLDANGAATQMARAFGDERLPVIDLALTAAIYDEGATRRNPLTGDAEVRKGGYWLPAMEFEASINRCQERSADILKTEKTTFGEGAAELDLRAEATLNRLAAVALACIEQADLVVEIGGHTDARGSRSLNEELSQARADEVARALTARGVAGEALIAIGYGDVSPIADNATVEGRAANRRITFEWLEPSVDPELGIAFEPDAEG